jgi:hypothetical protein
MWTWPTWVVSLRRVLEVVFVLLESPSPSRRIFIGSHSLPPPSLVRRIGPLVHHTEIATRHKDKAILYWFGPPESKTLHPVIRFVLLAWRDYMATFRWSAGYKCWPVPGRTPLPALYWVTDKVSGPESRSVTTRKPISSLFTSWKAYPSCLNPSGVSCLVRHVSRSFWIRSSGESSGRSLGGRVGNQLGRLGPLTGRRVFW